MTYPLLGTSLDSIFYNHFLKDKDLGTKGQLGRSFIFSSTSHKNILNNEQFEKVSEEFHRFPEIYLPPELKTVRNRSQWNHVLSRYPLPDGLDFDCPEYQNCCYFNRVLSCLRLIYDQQFLIDESTTAETCSPLRIVSEAEHNMHYWHHLIDAAFLHKFTIFRGEIVSESVRKKLFYCRGLKRSDAIIALSNQGEGRLEVGAIEVKASPNDNTDKLKLSLLLRDMLASICENLNGCPVFRKVKVLGFVCAGPRLTILEMHSPHGNMCILTSSPTYTIPSSYSTSFKLGLLVGAIVHAREVLAQTRKLLSTPYMDSWDRKNVFLLSPTLPEKQKPKKANDSSTPTT